MVKDTGWLYQRVADRQNTAYLIADEELIIQRQSNLVFEWVADRSFKMLGLALSDVFPELVGIEDHLHWIRSNSGEVYTLPNIYRPSEDDLGYFFDIHIERMSEDMAHLLVILNDVTQQTRQTQDFQQQRNELRLVSAQLTRANEQIAYILKRFVPEKIAQELIDDHQMPPPGTEGVGEATLFFADMRNFTGIAETMVPDRVIDLLNVYLTIIAEVVESHQGSVIQLVGDMLMAAFNIPSTLRDHELQAVQAAIEVREKLRKYLLENQPDAPDKIGFGIGINSGTVTTGYLGAKNLFQYSIIGDTTNVAAHLCSMASAYQIIISQSTLDGLYGQAEVARLGEVQLKQRQEALVIYELLGMKETE